MKKSELIRLLNEMPGDPEVQIMDATIQGFYMDEENRVGIYSDFEVEYIDDFEETESNWISITFESNENELTEFVNDLKI